MSDQAFHYTYSAAQRQEIAAIREKYVIDPEQPDKMEQLRRLDAGVSRRAMTVALAVGVIGTLIMGFGMSLIMSELGQTLGLDQTMLPGIVIGVVGMLGVVFAYPLYRRILRRERRKIAPQILRLTEELTQ